MKTFRKILAVVAALAVFAGLVTLMLFMNGWGETVPSEGQQILWALGMVTWPFIVGVNIWPK